MLKPHALNEVDLSQAFDAERLNELVTNVYTELKRLAAYHLKNERPNHNLRPTELVHEVYLLLRKQHSLDLNDRVYFLSLASSIMRRVLVNYAKHQSRKKRGEGRENLTYDQIEEKTLVGFRHMEVDVIALENALLELAQRDSRTAKIVKLHFYAGLTFAQIARLLNISLSTVMREWRFARNWLYRNFNRSS